MMLSVYSKQRAIFLNAQGLKAPTIAKILQEEGIQTTCVAVHYFLEQYKATGTIKRREGSGPPFKITSEVKVIVEAQIQEDDETTAYQLHKLLMETGHRLSICTVLRCRLQLGWTFRGSAYCQLIREANKVKRLAWAQQYLCETNEGFKDVIWMDESSIQLDIHKRFCYKKDGQAAKSKPRWVESYTVAIYYYYYYY